MKNKEIAKILNEIAEILELTDENPFRIRAFQRAAVVIEGLTQDIEEVAHKDELTKIKGIGEGIARRIKEYLNLGRIFEYEQLKAKFPPGLLEIMNIPGMGPKKAKTVFEKLKIDTVKKLEENAKQGLLANLPGFGKKTQENIIKGIELMKRSKGRILLYDAKVLINEILNELKKNKNIKDLAPCGSFRRKKETIGDIDILCTTNNPQDVMENFTKLSLVTEVIAKGKTKSTVILRGGIQCDLRVVQPESFGAALMYFTGSKEHNVALREYAGGLGYTINEYGLFKLNQKDKPVAGRSEEEIFKTLGLQWIAPELRENRGEIEMAKKNQLPELFELKDIKGDLHIHSNYSDGADSIEEIVEYAIKKGLEWIAICDHSQSLKVANGVSVSDMSKKIEEIKKINQKFKNKIKVLCGAEVDIFQNGDIDYPAQLLKQLDFVICAVHTAFKQPEPQMTERIIKALKNPYTDMLAHPTGRLLNKRNPYDVNIQKILETAGENFKAIEINAYPERLDLYDNYCKSAKNLGVKLGISTDSHSKQQIDFLELGVDVARRGWLEKEDVLNTLSFEELLKWKKEFCK